MKINWIYPKLNISLPDCSIHFAAKRSGTQDNNPKLLSYISRYWKSSLYTCPQETCLRLNRASRCFVTCVAALTALPTSLYFLPYVKELKVEFRLLATAVSVGCLLVSVCCGHTERYRSRLCFIVDAFLYPVGVVTSILCFDGISIQHFRVFGVFIQDTKHLY